MPTYRASDGQNHSAFPVSCWTEVPFSCCPFPPLLSVALPWAQKSPELGQWLLFPPVAGWQRGQSAFSCNYLLPTHSTRSSVIWLMTGFLQLEVTWRRKWGSVNHSGDAHKKIILISNLASTSDHQTWDCFQLLPVWKDNIRKFLSKSSCAALLTVPFFFPFPLNLMSKQPEA